MMPAQRADAPGCVDRSATHVEATDVPVAPRIDGVIRHLAIIDHQRVDAGAVILEIDDADYLAKVAAAVADLEAANAKAQAADARVDIEKSSDTASTHVDSAAAAVARAKAELAHAEVDYARAKKLHDLGAVSGQVLEAAQASRDAAQANVLAANANLTVAGDHQQVSESYAAMASTLAHAEVQRAQTVLELAKLELGYTRITAPIAGFIAKLGAREGQLVQRGATLLIVKACR